VKKILLPALLALLLTLLAVTGLTDEENIRHYLLLGQDGYADEIVEDARTDTIVLVSLDPDGNRIIMTSVLRDSKIKSPAGNNTKINLLYKNYGFDGIISCLERELEIDIEGAVLVNFNYVKPVIDALGGVDIEIDINEYTAIKKILLGSDPNMPDGPGLVHMTGRIALAYMRDRSSGSGDFSRTERQRKVLVQLIEKCKALSLTELVSIYNEVSTGIEMDISPLSILALLKEGYGMLQNEVDLVEFRVPQNKTYSYITLNGSSALDVDWDKNCTAFHELLSGED